MATHHYDLIVVGARCAGSPLAIQMVRKGYKVLVVDKATFPSDTISTHLIHPPGVAALKRLDLLDQLQSTGCPAIDTYSFNFADFTLSGSPAIDEAPVAYAPRRTVIDKLLVDAASEAGAEVREAFTVDEIIFEDGAVVGTRGHARGGKSIEEYARVVVGADGRHSMVAAAGHPEQYNEKPELLMGYYTYYSDLPVTGFEVYDRPHRGFATWPTNDGLTLVIAGWPIAEFAEYRKDIEGNFINTLDLVPSFGEKVHAATREERFYGASVVNYFRKPYGPGWALVGDAGYNKDYITAQGMQDAFLDAELCATALDESLSGKSPFDQAMSRYQTARDERVQPMFELTCELATLEPSPPEMQQVFGAMVGNQSAMDGFARVMAGATSPAEFFAPGNVQAIFAAAA